MTTSPSWIPKVSHDDGAEQTIHFRPPRRRYTQPNALMTLSRFAPMIDMSFLLLIFFMTTTRFAPPEGLLSSTLPQIGGRPLVGLPISPIVVRLGAAGADDVDVTISVDQFEGAPQTFADLPAFIREIHTRPGFDRETPVVIVADDRVRWDHVVACWNAALRADCQRIAFAQP